MPRSGGKLKCPATDLIPQGEEVEIAGTGGRGRISGARIDTKRLDWLAGPVSVNVNVASVHKSSPDNLLDCDFIDGTVADVRKKAPITLHCYLIEEKHPDAEHKPFRGIDPRER